jgi:outer membrane autotransporter protein
VSRSYDILHSGGLGGTTFSSLVVVPPNFNAALSYTSTDVLLNLTAGLGQGANLTVNQQNVATALNAFFNNGGTLPPGFAAVFGLSGASLANALNQLDGEVATGAQRAAFQIESEFLSLLIDPFVYGRGDGFAGAYGGMLGFAPQDEQAGLPANVALAYASVLKAPPAPPPLQRWTAWGSVYGGQASAKGDPNVIGSTNVSTGTFGFAGGMDYRLSPDTVVGFGLGAGGTGWGLEQSLGSGRSDTLQAGVYGATHRGPAYAAAAVAFAEHWMSTNRIALGDQLNADFTGHSAGVRLEAGYRYPLMLDTMALGVAPYAAVQTQWFHTPGYSERDSVPAGFGLTYQAMTANDTRSELGLRVDDLTAFNGMPLLLRGRLAWAHDWVSNPALSAVFQTLPGTNFVVFGAPVAHDAALVSAGAELRITPRLGLIAKFDGEFAAGAQTYAGSGTLRYAW